MNIHAALVHVDTVTYTNCFAVVIYSAPPDHDCYIRSRTVAVAVAECNSLEAAASDRHLAGESIVVIAVAAAVAKFDSLAASFAAERNTERDFAGLVGNLTAEFEHHRIASVVHRSKLPFGCRAFDNSTYLGQFELADSKQCLEELVFVVGHS